MEVNRKLVEKFLFRHLIAAQDVFSRDQVATIMMYVINVIFYLSQNNNTQNTTDTDNLLLINNEESRNGGELKVSGKIFVSTFNFIARHVFMG